MCHSRASGKHPSASKGYHLQDLPAQCCQRRQCDEASAVPGHFNSPQHTHAPPHATPHAHADARTHTDTSAANCLQVHHNVNAPPKERMTYSADQRVSHKAPCHQGQTTLAHTCQIFTTAMRFPSFSDIDIWGHSKSSHLPF